MNMNPKEWTPDEVKSFITNLLESIAVACEGKKGIKCEMGHEKSTKYCDECVSKYDFNRGLDTAANLIRSLKNHTPMKEEFKPIYEEWEHFNKEMLLVAPEEIDVMGQFILDMCEKAYEMGQKHDRANIAGQMVVEHPKPNGYLKGLDGI